MSHINNISIANYISFMQGREHSKLHFVHATHYWPTWSDPRFVEMRDHALVIKGGGGILILMKALCEFDCRCSINRHSIVKKGLTATRVYKALL
jgi:hypothetical protein